MTHRPLNLTVMLGGPSAEREVSLRSGAAVARALRSLGHVVHELDPREPSWTLPPHTAAVVLALHGTYGEDGTVQRQLDALGVPYTGCGAEASRLAFDKVEAKRRFLAAGVPTPRFEVLRSATAPWPAGWTPPVVLKPVRQGSSVGLSFLDDRAAWPEALAGALAHDTEVLLEERISGREATVGILGDRALVPIEVTPKQGVLDYRNKYTPGACDHYCPARFEPAVLERVRQVAWDAFRALGGRDYARVDVMIRDDTEPFVLEVNTLPGMTETSLLPEAAAAAGLDFAALCQRMVDLALAHPPVPASAAAG